MSQSMTLMGWDHDFRGSTKAKEFAGYNVEHKSCSKDLVSLPQLMATIFLLGNLQELYYLWIRPKWLVWAQAPQTN